MKKKLVLKPFVLPTLYILMVITLMVMSTTLIYSNKGDDDLTYVSDSVLENSVPVVSTNEIIVQKPFNSESVTVKTNYYNYLGENTEQEKSIVKYESTYVQNSGITYSSSEEFDVVSVMDGKVTKIYENELLGSIVEITHDKNMVSIYQMLKGVTVSENEIVKRGQVIAKSGTSKLITEGNNLHFELMRDGNAVNPNDYIGKNIKEI